MKKMLERKEHVVQKAKDVDLMVFKASSHVKRDMIRFIHLSVNRPNVMSSPRQFHLKPVQGSILE